MKPKVTPSAYAPVSTSMASCPIVRNRSPSGSPVTRDVTGSATCPRGIHCAAPISACPVPCRTYDRYTVLMPLATRPAQPMYCRLTPAPSAPCSPCETTSLPRSSPECAALAWPQAQDLDPRRPRLRNPSDRHADPVPARRHRDSAGSRIDNILSVYKAVYPEEAIRGHRAFITHRRQLRPSEEYRTPTDTEWDEFLGHFEHRKLAIGDCGRAYSTPCIHEHSCIRCPLLRIDPAQRHRLEEIRDNLLARITEAERKGWTGEAEGLRVSLDAANNKIAQADLTQARRANHVHLGIPAYRDIAAAILTPEGPHDKQ